MAGKETKVKDLKNNKNSNSFLDRYKIIIIILLIFLLGFAIRGHLLKYEYMFEFDPYWHLRGTSYVLKDGDAPDNDPLGFYNQGGINYNRKPQFLWYLTAYSYKLFTFGAEYDKWLLLSFARYLPAIFGALISIAMFFLGKEMYNSNKVGLVMAIVAATIPAFVYRTMAGFFEEDSLGFLWMIIGFIFLVKAIKNIHATKQHLTYAVISALFFVLMAVTWDMFLLIPLVLISYFFTNIVYMAYKGESNQKIAHFVKILIVTFILFTAMTSLFVGTYWINKTTNYVSDYLPINEDNIDRINNDKFEETDVIGRTVGEENTGKQFFLLKYNLMVIAAFLSLILIPIYLLWPKLFGFYKNHKDHLTLIIFFWVLICGFMAWSKLKFTYTLGLPIAAGSGFLFYIYLNWIKNKSKSIFSKRLGAIFIILFLLTSIAAGAHFVSTKVNPISSQRDWQSAFEWVNDNAPQDAKLFNWWDQGHWITYFTERRASSDNTNSFMQGNSDFANFVITDDFNKVKSIIKEYKPDYIMSESSFFSKYNSFGMYAYMTTNVSDARITKYFGVTLPCRAVKKSVSGELLYNCNNMMFEKEKYNMLPSQWTNKPTDIYQNQPVYMYQSELNDKLYFINSAVNNSIFAKVWFGHPDYKEYFELVYNSGDVKIFKVNNDKFE